MMFKILNFEKIIFIFALSISFVFSISAQAKTKEEQAEEIISYSSDIDYFMSFYKDKSIKLVPTILVEGITASIIPRTMSVVGDNFRGKEYRESERISSELWKYGVSLRGHKKFEYFILLNRDGEITRIHISPKYKEEVIRLNELKSLSSLSIDNLSDVTLDLTGFNSIKELFIYKSKIKNVFLPQKNLIEVLNIYSSPVEYIVNLDKLENIDRITISGTKIKSLSSLENSSKIRRFMFFDNELTTELPDFNSMKKLEYLHFFSSEVEGIQGISNLENLKVLFTGQSFNYSGVKFPKSLEYLSTGGTVNSSFPDLDNNTNLKELSIVDTNSSDMSLLNLPSNLEKLTLAYNKINKIEGIDGLEKLKEVNLRGNNIEKVEGLDGLESIEYLKLDKNKITKVEGLKNLSGVKGISFENNPIETLDFSEIEHLKNTKVLMWYTPFWKTATKEDKRKLDNLARKGHL